MTASPLRFLLRRASLPVVGTAMLLLAVCSPAALGQGRDPRVQAMIDRAAAGLRRSLPASEEAGVRALGAYGLLAAGASPNDPLVAGAVERVLGKCSGTAGRYAPGPHHYYEAGVDLMLLEAAGGKRHSDKMAMIVRYVISGQEPTGCWNYANARGSAGDTSITQYALLGLWSAKRAGIEIPQDVWQKAAAWQIRTQHPEGDFPYNPDSPLGDRLHSMTAAGIANLLLCRLMLFPDAAPVGGGPRPPREEPTGPRFGVLQEVDLDAADKPEGPRNPAGSPPKAVMDSIDGAVRRALAYLVPRFTFRNPSAPLPYYYMYVIERMIALAGQNVFGSLDWYAAGVEVLDSSQDANGLWNGEHTHPPAHTAWGILFLTRATGKILGRTPEAVAGGILIGARGLPDDLKNVNIVDGKAEQPKLKGPIADLLTQLENLDDVPVASAQEAIVEQVLVGDREALVGQKDRLKKLANSRDPEIRRTAVWALARCDDLRLAPIMIRALDDPDADVLVEARNALCYLSRQPRGDGQKDAPLADVSEDATDEQKAQAVARWRSAVRTHWRTWYFRVRPYDERDDLDEVETTRAKKK